MQGSEFFTAYYLQVTVIGWCGAAGTLFCLLLRRPSGRPAWLKYLLCGLAAAAGATLALISLWAATTMLVAVAFGLPGLGTLILYLFPLLLLLGAVIAIGRAVARSSS